MKDKQSCETPLRTRSFWLLVEVLNEKSSHFPRSNRFGFIALWRTILHILWEDVIDRKQKILIKSSVDNCGYNSEKTNFMWIGSRSALLKPFDGALLLGAL